MTTPVKKKYGMIPFFIPHLGCPHICVFCNQTRIAGHSDVSKHELASSVVVSTEPIYGEVDNKAGESINLIQMPPGLSRAEIAHTIREYVGDNRSNKFWEVAFYGGSFSAISRILQTELLVEAKRALDVGLIDGIRCSTRPDALYDDDIDFLYEHGIRTVEIGVQSMNDAILETSKRGHTAQDVRDAVKRLRNKGIKIGLQLLPGLPGETMYTIVETAVEISKLQPDFVRIYPVLVIENTELATMYRQGLYEPLTVEQAVRYSAFMKTWFEDHHIEVIRTGLQSTEELDFGTGLVAGPYEPAMGELVVNEQWRIRIEDCIVSHEQYFEFLRSAIKSGLFIPLNQDDNVVDDVLRGIRPRCVKPQIVITYPQSLTSKIRGVRQCNMKYFAQYYPDFQWCWQVRKSDAHHRLIVNNQSVTIDIDDIRYVI